MDSRAPTSPPAAAIDFGEFRRGWRVLLLSAVAIATSAAVLPLYSFGPLVLPLEQAFGWSRGDVQSAVTFLFIGLIFGAPLCAWLLKRFGQRATALGGLVAFGLSWIALTQLDGDLWKLYLVYGLFPLIGAGTMQITWTQLISLWFEKNRGLALALILSGTGVSALVMPLWMGPVIERFGWEAAFIGLTLVPLLVTLPLCWLWMPTGGPQNPHERSEQLKVEPKSGTETSAIAGINFGAAARSWPFWSITIVLTVVVVGILGMITNAVPLMRDNGLSSTTANSVYSATGVSLVVGRMVAGYLVDRVWAPAVAFVMLTLPAIGCLLFGMVDTNIVLLVMAAALIGLGAGAEYDIAAYLATRYFGMKDYGRIFAAQFSVVAVGTCLAPALFGQLHDITGSYHTMLWICGIGFAVAPALLLTLGPYPHFDAAIDQSGFAVAPSETPSTRI